MTAVFWIGLGMVVALALVLALVLALRWLAGFPAQTPEDYRSLPGEALDLRAHLSGPLVAHGVIYGPTGRVVSRFSGDFEGVWQGNSGVLKERYRYASGKEEGREWRLLLGNDGTFRGEADDVVGPAQGRLSGPTAQLRYRLRLAEDAGGHVLNATDWMYLAPDGAVVNRSQFRKFGIKVAELVAVMHPKETT